MSDENQNQETKKEDANKEAKKFDANWKKVVALLAGEALFKPKKIGGVDLSAALEELAKEEKEALIKQFKDKAKALVQSKKTFDKVVKEEQDKANKAILEKKKEFNKEMDGLFSMVDKIQTIEKEYYETLRGMTVILPEEKPEGETPDDAGTEA